jgi:nucleotide-binding universal stress UspA family protein
MDAVEARPHAEAAAEEPRVDRAAALGLSRLAPALGARVVAVYAFEPLVEWVPDHDPKGWRRAAEWQVAGWIEPLRDLGTSVDVVVVEGLHPVTAIADTAVKRAAQLVVVGTHGLGSFTKMRLGGVAVQLVHHAGLPVVLVPPTADQA